MNYTDLQTKKDQCQFFFKKDRKKSEHFKLLLIHEKDLKEARSDQ